MNKTELIAAMVETSGLTKKDCEAALTAFTKERPARVGRNPRTGESMTYPACKVPVFKPGKALKDAIK